MTSRKGRAPPPSDSPSRAGGGGGWGAPVPAAARASTDGHRPTGVARTPAAARPTWANCPHGRWPAIGPPGPRRRPHWRDPRRALRRGMAGRCSSGRGGSGGRGRSVGRSANHRACTGRASVWSCTQAACNGMHGRAREAGGQTGGRNKRKGTRRQRGAKDMSATCSVERARVAHVETRRGHTSVSARSSARGAQNVHSRRGRSACAWRAQSGSTGPCCKCHTQSRAAARGRCACGCARGRIRRRPQSNPELYKGAAAPFREPSAGGCGGNEQTRRDTTKKRSRMQSEQTTVSTTPLPSTCPPTPVQHPRADNTPPASTRPTVCRPPTSAVRLLPHPPAAHTPRAPQTYRFRSPRVAKFLPQTSHGMGAESAAGAPTRARLAVRYTPPASSAGGGCPRVACNSGGGVGGSPPRRGRGGSGRPPPSADAAARATMPAWPAGKGLPPSKTRPGAPGATPPSGDGAPFGGSMPCGAAACGGRPPEMPPPPPPVGQYTRGNTKEGGERALPGATDGRILKPPPTGPVPPGGSGG